MAQTGEGKHDTAVNMDEQLVGEVIPPLRAPSLKVSINDILKVSPQGNTAASPLTTRKSLLQLGTKTPFHSC